MPVKKAATGKKAPAKKASPRKTATSKNAPAKKRARRSPASAKSKASGSVTLPSTLPKRVREHVLVLEGWLTGRVDEWFIRTARYSGLFFMVVGGLLTVWSFSGMADMSATQVAATISSSTTTTESTTETASTDKEPDATFDVSVMTSNPSILSVHVIVPEALEVTVMALYTATNDIHVLGSATRVEPEHWVYEWETLDYQNGEYKLMAEITNQYETYTEHDSTTYDVYNEINDTSAEPTVDEVHFSLQEGAVVDGDTPVVVEAPGYDEVTLSVREVATGDLQQLDLVSHDDSTDTWTYTWPTEQFPNGEFALETKLIYDQTGDVLQGPTVLVENVTVESATVAEGDDPSKDEVTFSLHEGDTLSGEVEISIEAPGYDNVAAYVRNRSTGEETPLGGIFTDSTTSLWDFLWMTGDFADGEYGVFAQATYGTDTHTVAGPRVHIDNATASTPNPSIATDESLSEEDDEEPVAAPQLHLSSDPLSGTISMRVDGQAEFIEVYARPQLSTTRVFLGLAVRVEPTKWEFAYDTHHLPNGAYGFIARARANGQFLVSEPVVRTVENVVEVSPSNESDPSTDLEPIVTETEEDVAFVEERDNDMQTPSSTELAETLLAEFSEAITEETQRLSTAVRSQDEEQIRRAKERLRELQDRIIASALSDDQAATLIDRIEEHVQAEFARIQAKVETVEALIRERTQGNITADTDGDGITDYDEVHLYQTDPKLADTDNDGFTDGVEILEGYDPLDASPEAVVRHESPRESGIVRDDLLAVSSIEAVADESNEDGVDAQAEIRGTALPNSFVTLYIYSTPTIVTIRTEPDGSWVYRFDKELEDGEHEIYVGVTDNAGRVVAKSRPFAFVKRAQAYTPVDAATAEVTTEPPESIASTNNLLTVVSIAVVAIGLVLVLIGWNLDATRPKRVTEEATP